jgi:lipoate---protein ligase
MSDVDPRRAAAVSMPVVRRRSGGGAVVVGPGHVMWGDVEIAAGDFLWEPDVGRGAWWVGDSWAAALGDVEVSGATVHRGPSVVTRWSRKVCFAGVGPGEVLVGGRKSVGIAQRRTRTSSRLQFAVLLRWDPGALLDLLDLGEDTREAARRDLADVAHGVGTNTDALASAFERNLP